MRSRPAGRFSQLQADNLLIQQNIFLADDSVAMVMSKKLIFELAPLGHFLQEIGQDIGFEKTAAQFILH